MMRSLGLGALLVVAAVAGPSSGAWAHAANLETASWAISPEDAACHTDLELVSRSGAVAPIALISDGEHMALRFAKEGVAARAFLPIRVDGRPFSNLVQRTGEEGVAVMNLSDETLAAMRRGKTLQVAWLTDEAVSGSLAGAGQGLADLKTCGAQVAGQHRAREADIDAQRVRAQSDARVKAMADEQLATARAQTAAAEAERQRVTAEARRANAQAEALTAQAAQQRALAAAEQRQAYADQERRRQLAAQRYEYGDGDPPFRPDPGPYYRPYYAPR